MKKKLLSAVFAGASCLGFLTACGGGGGGGGDDAPAGNPGPQSFSFSGVAAVGAPLTGTVTVKDANGVTRSVPIGANGAYTVDVSGMAAPFVFRASGSANGHTYTVHSAATSADINGTINITQLTDLIIGNIAGQIASAYFDNGSFGGLTATELNAEAAKLKEKLLPVLSEVGVGNTVDLLRTQFTPLASALDSALDIIRVSIDSQSNIATITNIITQQAIIDDLETKAAAEAAPPVLNDITNLATAATDIEQIRTAFANFSTLFANGLPSDSAILAKFTNDYLGEDADGTAWAASFAADTSMVGMTFTDIDIKLIYHSTLSYALVDFTVKDQDGVEMDRLENFLLQRGMDGIWRLHGDQRVLDLSGYVQVYRDLGNDCTMTGLEFDIIDDNSANNGGTIDHIMVFGHGLPDEGLRYEPPANGGPWEIAGQGSSYFVMGNSCAPSPIMPESAIAGIPDNAHYLIVAYSSADNSTRINFPTGAIMNAADPFANGGYALTIQKRPPTLAEAVASTRFPQITTPSSAAAFQNYVGGPLNVEASNLNPNSYGDAILEQNTVGGDYRNDEYWVGPSPIGTLNIQMEINPPNNGDPITYRNLSIGTLDQYRRNFMVSY